MSPKPKSKRKTPKQQETPTTIAANSTPSDFSFAIARIAVSQISQSVGFRATQVSALETLTRIAVKYIEAVASASASYAAVANRSNTNVFDFTNALHDLQLVQSFNGASFPRQRDFCVLGSSVLTDLANFVRWNEETPFARPIPRGEKIDTGKWDSIPRERGSRGNGKLGLHVPRWLPVIPEVKKPIGKRKNGEELWENLVAENGCGVGECESSGGVGECENGGNGKSVCLEMGEKKKKGRVRFRIGGGVEEKKGVVGLGVNLRRGVCRGGKRVCWDNNKIS